MEIDNRRASERHEWIPGVLADGVSAHAPCGMTQMLAMMLINKALAEGRKANMVVENIEVTISITDDAIHHMMRKR